MENMIRYPEIDRYIRSVIKREEGILKELEDYAVMHFIPVVQPETAALLKVILKIRNPLRILEAGTAIGYSAILMAKYSDEKTAIDTIEIDEDMASAAETNFKRSGFGSRIKVLRGDALEVMQCLSTPYDMIFLDASKGQYAEYLPECMRLTAGGGLIVSDNILYKGLVAKEGTVEHKHRTIAARLREYLSMLCGNPLLETSVIPIGDGIAVSYRL